ncbi:MAG: hydrogenase maturation protease [Gammaproteobacteria bacterium]
MNKPPIKPILIFGYGNVSRGDDALGPLLLEYIEQHADLAGIELLTDFQLQIEHALDLVGRELVLFVDASVVNGKAVELTRLTPIADKSYTSHAMSPAAVLQVYTEINKAVPPPSFLLGIEGRHFELGTSLSPEASKHLQLASSLVEDLLRHPELSYWTGRAEALSLVID